MVAPTPLECSVNGCDYTTPAGAPTWDLMATFLTTHTQGAHSGGGGQAAQNQTTNLSKLEKLPRPTFTLNMTESQWSFTKLQWDNYIQQSVVSPAIQLLQLQAACGDSLRQRVFDTGTYSSLTNPGLFIAKMKELSVIVVHKSIHLRNLWKMSQQADEPIRAYAARVTSTADMCTMVVKCPNQACLGDVVYRDHVVHQMIIHGMRDNDIRVRVLSRNTSGELTTLDKLIDYIAAEEAGTAEASDLISDSGIIGGIRRKSTYHQQRNQQHQQSSQPRQAQKCRHCGESKHGSTNSPEDRKNHCKAWGQLCNNCRKPNHLANMCQSAKASMIEAEDNSTTPDGDVNAIRVANFFSLEAAPGQEPSPPPATPADIPPIISYMRTANGPVTTLPLPHHVHDIVAGWHPTRPKASPTITAHYSLDRAAYAELGLNLPRHSQSAHNPGRSTVKPSVADTGAQLHVVPYSLLESMKIKAETIFPVETSINGASNVPIMVEGGVLLRVTAYNTKTGAVRHSRQLAYVSRHVSVPYLSLSACIDLGLVPATFPEVGAADTSDLAHLQTISSPMQQPCSNTGVPGENDSPCQCPVRALPPTSQPQLPCAPTPENLPVLKKYILDRYKSSAFNCCEKQPLNLMDGSPPLRIFVEEDAAPVAVHTPSQVPLHWQKDVKRGLDRDCQLGVLEKVPVNDPVTWCHRMVISPKPDGSPRRVVDLTPLNKHAPRQTHHTESPWAIVSSIPSDKVKSTVDCWHGYHSVPLHPADRHLTTFITPWGRYRYRTAPQGLISAGDGYTHRKAEIMNDFDNVKNCVDDSLVYDNTIEENFHRVCAFLEQGARGGCTFNPKKFQFGERSVKFLGFLVTDTGIKPTADFRNSILSFPTPKSLTDIRSFFGAVNQISYFFAIAPVMAPFRHLLSSKVPFQWSTELQTAFDAAKQEILLQCEHGVRSFDPKLPTALATDWSKLSMGYWLTQKYCSCPGEPLPGCCNGGWQTVLCGSKFCSPAESRYHPIEGEGQATITGLEKCKFFVLGLENLILCVDHKPLIAILGDKQDLADIPNPRIMNFKLKSMMYRFRVKYIPGKDHVIPDAFSRRNDSPIGQAENMTNVRSGYSDTFGPPSWVSHPSISAIAVTNTSAEADASNIEELLTGVVLASIMEINQHSLLSPLTSTTQPTALSWSRLEVACLSCDQYKLLHRTVQAGVSDKREDWDQQITDFYPHRQSLVTVGPVVMFHDRPIIPQSLRDNVLDHLHAGHASATSMFERASTSLYWPNLRADMINFRASCNTCTKYAPSNPALPPTEPEHPTYPFQSICADFFHVSPNNYLAVVDRYSNWLSIFLLPKDDSAEIVKVLRNYLSIFGIPCTLTSDGASVFTSKLMEDFCDRWGIVHRVATAYNPRANKRAEVGVKSAKRLIRGNLTQTGTLHTDRLARALLAHRNTPCPVTGLSPAQIVFGRVLRDFLPLQPGKFQPRPEWRQAAEAREAAYAKRHIRKGEQLSRGSKLLPPLLTGDHVAVQNQTGQNPRQWLQTGVVIETGPHNSYFVSIDGSRTVTKRNRQFLRKIVPFQQPAKPTTLPAPATRPNHLMKTPLPNPALDVTPALQPQAVDSADQDHPVPADDPPQPSVPSQDTSADATAPKPRPQLPLHLRERWIVAKPSSNTQDPTTLTSDLAAVSPVQYSAERPLAYHWPSPLQQNMYHPMMTYNVAPIYPSVLPYMMPQQHHLHNPVMFNPTMYQ